MENNFTERMLKVLKYIKKSLSILMVCVFLILMIFTNTTAVSATTAGSDSSSSQEKTETDDTKDIEFEITSSKTKKITTAKSTYTFKGTSDPEKTLTLNGEKVKRNKDGSFSIKVSLKPGSNKFTFVHKKVKYVYTIQCNYVLVDSYSPSGVKTYDSGKKFTVTVKARKGSTVTATFRKKKIKLAAKTDTTSSFVTFSGKFTLPKNSIDINYGKVKFTAKNSVTSKTFYSGNIICKKTTKKATYSKKDPEYNLKGGKYLDVGKGKIAEIVFYEAETFDAKSTNDWSRPTNNYLPKGTVDYCSGNYAYYNSGSTKKTYTILRCGLQTYKTKEDPEDKKKDLTVTKVYSGSLPDHNEIGVVSFKNGTTHTTLTLDTMWKAPFYFKLPQSYTNPSKQDYTIEKATYEYIDITFCYSTVFNGKVTVPKDNPIFKSAKLYKDKSHYRLRLYLKEKGKFYGWTADFNSKGQLIFKFLNPAKIKKAKNNYGYSLKGVKILLDVGHGGKDPGAVSFSNKYTEAYSNLHLAKLVKKELESIGAEVYLTRSKDVFSSSDDKLKQLRKLKPDFCIAIHHNSSYSSSANGFDSYYSQPFSAAAAKYIRSETSKTKLYKSADVGWHYYYTARSTVCPVVLTENGFMSSSYDYNKIINAKNNLTKAKAITKGVVRYFDYIQ